MGKRGGLLGGGPPTCLGLGTCVGSPDGAQAGGRGPSSTTSTILDGGHTNGAPFIGRPREHRAGEWEPVNLFFFFVFFFRQSYFTNIDQEGAKYTQMINYHNNFFFRRIRIRREMKKRDREVEVNAAEVCPKIWPFNVNDSR